MSVFSILAHAAILHTTIAHTANLPDEPHTTAPAQSIFEIKIGMYSSS